MIGLKALHLHWRVSHYKGTTYRSYSLAHSYRHNGTNRKDIVDGRQLALPTKQFDEVVIQSRSSIV